ncbi:MAG: C39 family peptidase [Lachnospiraceae bacterium]|nr:C39 family peptidase [Lachnospiraceae bacterium]
MKKRGLLTVVLLLVIGLCACKSAGADKKMPELHVITPDSSMGTLDDADGADAFGNSLDHADSRYYVINDYYNMESKGGLHILSHFATYQQTTEYSCGCASALMVLNYYGINGYNEMQICEQAGTDTSRGTSVEGLAAFMESAGLEVTCHADTDYYFESIEDCEAYLIRTIDGGAPVMVDWVDWYGHWQTIIGIDTCDTDDPYDDVLIMADSYDITDHFQDGYYIVPFGRFFDMWREGPCAEKEVPYEQPFVTAFKK